jgi:hypothetical protein
MQQAKKSRSRISSFWAAPLRLKKLRRRLDTTSTSLPYAQDQNPQSAAAPDNSAKNAMHRKTADQQPLSTKTLGKG